MKTKRLRIFAGPNGSGKSTLFHSFSQKFDSGIFVNADLIERKLHDQNFLDLSEFNLNLSQTDLEQFLSTEKIATLLQKSDLTDKNILIKQNILLHKDTNLHGYLGAVIAAFIRHEMMKHGLKFSFETVMSHKSKITEIIEARNLGYKTYLYFICTDSPEINVSRVENRVQKGGHPVEEKTIIKRYKNSLDNLFSMILAVDDCYLFDNSSLNFNLIAEIRSNRLRLLEEPEKLPDWFKNFVLVHYL
jgi:predicted ABC-type ATPase